MVIIITGNKLQSYALKKVLNDINLEVKTGWKTRNIIGLLLKSMLYILTPFSQKHRRYSKFLLFSLIHLNMKYYQNAESQRNKYNYVIVGSDQVWNYTFPSFSEYFFAPFSDKSKNIAYAASVGVDSVSDEYLPIFKNGLANFKAISVREERAKEIIEEITGRKDVEVVLDPTMLLTGDEWEKVMKKPKKLKEERYILNYFLGDLSDERKKEIERIAKENNCKVINLLDKNDELYTCGPSEFLFLEKNAFLICTDSFHSSVFGVLFDRPFIVFDREDKNANMGSRLDTLINKLELKDRRFTGTITEENLNHDYSESYKRLEEERKKSISFLKRALNLEK